MSAKNAFKDLMRGQDVQFPEFAASLAEAEGEHALSVERRVEAESQHAAVAGAAAAIRDNATATKTALALSEDAVRTRRAAIEVIKADVLECIRTLARDRASREASKLRSGSARCVLPTSGRPG